MSSPLDTDPAEEWFRQFDAALRRLPAEERVRQHEEMQQHLEGLVTAHEALGKPYGEAWEAALTQFGDPTQIGRKMYQEWQQGRTGFRADMKAILFGMGLIWLQALVIPLCGVARILWLNAYGLFPLSGSNLSIANLPLAIQSIIGLGGTLLICVVVGRKYPIQAIKAAFYSSLLWHFVWCLEILASSMHNKISSPQPLSAILENNLLWAPEWALGHAVIAYLASVTRRGWYRPSLADFKLGLPHRRTQLSR